MSTPGQSEPASAKEGDRRRSLGKYVKRMSSVFKREKSSKSTAPASSAPATPSAPQSPALPEESAPKTAAPPAPAASPEPTPAPVQAATTTPASAPAATPAAPVADEGDTHQLNRSELQQERARALFAKYGLTLESHEWITTSAQPISVQRIERPIRMRVHRNCHNCGATFGSNKTCGSCEHRRCKRCPRYPKKKTPGEKGKGKEAVVEAPAKKKKMLSVTLKTGEERIYQQTRQRVRRTCHKCNALFVPPTATVCDQCHHVRCTKCPRDPAKLAKWPNGYPGDADANSDTEVENAPPQTVRRIWRKPRTRVRWQCEQCNSQFIEGSPQCPGCGHERCEKCTRSPLKKVKREQQFSPDVIRAVEEKLRALAMEEERRRNSPGIETA